MSFTKRVVGDYTIETLDNNGISSEVIIKSNQLRVYGDLIVTGDQSVVSETNLAIKDREILLNEGETGPGVTNNYAGINVDRGFEIDGITEAFIPGIRWNEITDKWELSTDGTTWQTILSSGGAGLEHVVEDLTPQLGGDLDVNNQRIVSDNLITLTPEGLQYGVYIENSYLGFDRLASDPTLTVPLANTVLYHKAPGQGDSGLYVKKGDQSVDELITKTKAIVYSIIF